jgi:hypothetical protein
MSSVASPAGLIHLGMDTSKDTIVAATLLPGEESPVTDRVFNEEEAIWRLKVDALAPRSKPLANGSHFWTSSYSLRGDYYCCRCRSDTWSVMQNPSPQASDLQRCLRDIEFCISLMETYTFQPAVCRRSIHSVTISIMLSL